MNKRTRKASMTRESELIGGEGRNGRLKKKLYVNIKVEFFLRNLAVKDDRHSELCIYSINYVNDFVSCLPNVG